LFGLHNTAPRHTIQQYRCPERPERSHDAGGLDSTDRSTKHGLTFPLALKVPDVHPPVGMTWPAVPAGTVMKTADVVGTSAAVASARAASAFRRLCRVRRRDLDGAVAIESS